MKANSTNKAGMRDWFGAIAPALGILAAFSLGAYWLGKLPDFYHGEDFYLFHYAETHSFREAIYLFFLENGRVFEAVYWTALYKVLGYQPALQHLVSLMLNLLAALAASFAVYRGWPSRFQRRWLVNLFAVLVFFNPYTTKWALTLSGDNSRISIILFFLAVICVQQWVITKFKHGWFALGFFLFAMAFNYENVSLLFPVAYLLSYPLLSSGKITRPTKVMAGAFAVVSFGLPLLPVLLYSGLNIVSHPALRGAGVFSNPLLRVITAIKHLGLYFYNSADPLTIYVNQATLRWLPLILLAAVMLLASVIVLTIRRQGFAGNKWLRAVKAGELRGLICLYVASVWLIVVSVAPYAIAYHFSSPYVRFFAISIYGFALLLVLSLALLRSKVAQALVILVMLVVVLSGLAEFNAYGRYLEELETSPLFDYLTMLEIVPQVKEDTSFFMVNFAFGTDAWRSCALALQMLYDVKDLRCGYISSIDENIQVERSEGVVNTNEGGRFSEENWIIVGINPDGSKYIIPEIQTSDPYFIDWQSADPIQTNYSQMNDGEIKQTGMYLKLLERSR